MSKRSNRSNNKNSPNRFNVENWTPKTELGQKVKDGEITDIDQILEKGLPIMEIEIVDALLPDLEEEVMDVNLV